MIVSINSAGAAAVAPRLTGHPDSR